MKKLAKVIGCLRLKEMVKVPKNFMIKEQIKVMNSYVSHIRIKTVFSCIFDFSNLILRGLNKMYLSKKEVHVICHSS